MNQLEKSELEALLKASTTIELLAVFCISLILKARSFWPENLSGLRASLPSKCPSFFYI